MTSLVTGRGRQTKPLPQSFVLSLRFQLRGWLHSITAWCFRERYPRWLGRELFQKRNAAASETAGLAEGSDDSGGVLVLRVHGVIETADVRGGHPPSQLRRGRAAPGRRRCRPSLPPIPRSLKRPHFSFEITPARAIEDIVRESTKPL